MKYSRLGELLLTPLRKGTVALVMLSALITFFVSGYLVFEKLASTEFIVERLIPSIAQRALLTDNPELFVQQSNELVQHGEFTYLALLDVRKKVIASIPGEPDSRFAHKQIDILSQPSTHLDSGFVDESDRLNKPELLLGYVEYRLNYRFVVVLVVSALGLMVFLMLTTLLIHRQIHRRITAYVVKPTLSMNESIVHIIEGGYGSHLSVQDESEIGDLANQINRLSEQLKSSEDAASSSKNDAMRSKLNADVATIVNNQELNNLATLNSPFRNIYTYLLINKQAVVDVLGETPYRDMLLAIENVLGKTERNGNSIPLQAYTAPSIRKLDETVQEIQKTLTTYVRSLAAQHSVEWRTEDLDLQLANWIYLDHEKLQNAAFSMIKFMADAAGVAGAVLRATLRATRISDSRLLLHFELLTNRALFSPHDQWRINEFLLSKRDSDTREWPHRETLLGLRFYAGQLNAALRLETIGGSASRIHIEFDAACHPEKDELARILSEASDKFIPKLPRLAVFADRLGEKESTEIQRLESKFSIKHYPVDLSGFIDVALPEADIYLIDCDDVVRAQMLARHIRSTKNNLTGFTPPICALISRACTEAESNQLFDSGFSYTIRRPITADILVQEIAKIMTGALLELDV